jgi:hypothetical protein
MFGDRMPGVRAGRSTIAVLLLAFSACSGVRRAGPPGGAGSAVCRSCFWKYEPVALKRELIAIYRGKHFDDPLLEAQRKLLLATVTEDRTGACKAREAFARLPGTEATRDPARDLYVAETLAFTAATCRADAADAFRLASAKARGVSAPFKARVYADLADGRFTPSFGDASIVRKLDVPKTATAFILGASKIVVNPGARVGAQVERTVRDWLSYQMSWDGAARPVTARELLNWHEGARLRDLLTATDANIFPLTGALAVRHGDRWLAADGDGVFRFEVLDDKIQYPTTLVYGDVALLVDTHGISALVEPARREGVSLVVGCGDTEAKMKAAFALAQSGIDVWFPCDRFVGDVLGYDAPGVLIGSAPVRREGDHAVIGDRPVRFELGETIVAEDFKETSPMRYYDAPARYFRALSAIAPLAIDYVIVDGAGQSSRVVARAEALSASAIAVRVQTVEDAAPVRAWLAASPHHRAVLFHTAPYPAGYALFEEFPKQTTFGDPRPSFVEGQVSR